MIGRRQRREKEKREKEKRREKSTKPRTFFEKQFGDALGSFFYCEEERGRSVMGFDVGRTGSWIHRSTWATRAAKHVTDQSQQQPKNAASAKAS